MGPELHQNSMELVGMSVSARDRTHKGECDRAVGFNAEHFLTLSCLSWSNAYPLTYFSLNTSICNDRLNQGHGWKRLVMVGV